MTGLATSQPCEQRPARNWFPPAFGRAAGGEHVEVISKVPESRTNRPPVVLVHGAWCWDLGFMDRLVAHGFTCHALSLRGFRAFLEMLLAVRAKPNAATVPMHVVGTYGDGLFPVREVEATARAYGTRAHLFHGIGHDMMLDVGWEAVADHVADRIDDWCHEGRQRANGMVGSWHDPLRLPDRAALQP